MKKLFVSLFVLIFIKANAQVSLYTAPGFAGKPVLLESGNYLRLTTGLFNKIQSLKVPRGYVVELFSSYYFTGKRVTFFKDAESFPPEWGNKAGSIKIFKPESEMPDSILAPDPWEKIVSFEPMTRGVWYPVNWNDTGKVILFSENNFTGKTTELDLGNYKSTLPWSISSIKIPADKKIFVYTKPDFKGINATFTNDDNSLIPFWNNKIASIKVMDVFYGSLKTDTAWKSNGEGGLGISGMGQGGGGKGTGFMGSGGGGKWSYGSSASTARVVIFDVCNFSGASRALGNGDYANMPPGFAFKVSAIRVPAGKKVFLYTGKNFQGSSKTLEADNNCLPSDFNNKIQSIKIVPAEK